MCTQSWCFIYSIYHGDWFILHLSSRWLVALSQISAFWRYLSWVRLFLGPSHGLSGGVRGLYCPSCTAQCIGWGVATGWTPWSCSVRIELLCKQLVGLHLLVTLDKYLVQRYKWWLAKGPHHRQRNHIIGKRTTLGFYNPEVLLCLM